MKFRFNIQKLILNLSSKKMMQFIQFGVVGLSGFIWDTATVYTLRLFLGLSLATILAYFIAATWNWFINRIWTFHNPESKRRPLFQWLRFLATNMLGFLLNRGTVFILFYFSTFCRQTPVIPLAIGAIAGMFANFNLSRKLVFTSHSVKTF